ncbi:hypothetical protein AMK17_25265 [Streptomyces sp. CB00072]|uniref:hypothetical protein n=1 Tax=Streptomyces sp. CB00072 TaxID=1703928 RepID=UPI00093F1720|nr:hypothetical protein [Streptomyces sp. CB00072]OKI54318.1 hypothetical protein AMK17_25265 [Streptomyces sp. CB00072]
MTQPQTIAVARYVTVGGATVTTTHDHQTKASVSECGGCPAVNSCYWESRADRWDNGKTWADIDARHWAQSHADTCRATPAA